MNTFFRMLLRTLNNLEDAIDVDNVDAFDNVINEDVDYMIDDLWIAIEGTFENAIECTIENHIEDVLQDYIESLECH